MYFITGKQKANPATVWAMTEALFKAPKQIRVRPKKFQQEEGMVETYPYINQHHFLQRSQLSEQMELN